MQSVYKVSDPTSGELSAWVEPSSSYTVSGPTSRVLSEGIAACLTCSEPSSIELYAGGSFFLMVSKTSFRGLSMGGGGGLGTVYKV